MSEKLFSVDSFLSAPFYLLMYILFDGLKQPKKSRNEIINPLPFII